MPENADSPMLYVHTYLYCAPQKMTDWWIDLCVTIYKASLQYLAPSCGHVLGIQDLQIHSDSIPGMAEFIVKCDKTFVNKRIQPRMIDVVLGVDEKLYVEIRFRSKEKPTGDDPYKKIISEMDQAGKPRRLFFDVIKEASKAKLSEMEKQS